MTASELQTSSGEHPSAPMRHAVKTHASSIQKLGPEQIIQRLLGPVLLSGPDLVVVPGAIRLKHALAVWTWLIRDIDPNLGDYAAVALGGNTPLGTDEKFSSLLGELIGSQYRAASQDINDMHRLSVQLGGEEVLKSVPNIHLALKNFKHIQQATHFSKSLAAIKDRHALSIALSSLPHKSIEVTRFLAIACVGKLPSPQNLVGGIMQRAGGSEPARIRQSEMGPFIDAILGHAQNEIGLFAEKIGGYADVDLACRILVRFHHLIRSLHPILEEDRREVWFLGMARLVGAMSDKIKPLIEGVDFEVRRSLRAPRIGPDRLDEDEMLNALNHLYLLSAARDSRDSLALNALIETSWNQVGASIEAMMKRMIEQIREQPDNEFIQGRFEHGLKLAEVRFSKSYADVLDRARHANLG